MVREKLFDDEKWHGGPSIRSLSETHNYFTMSAWYTSSTLPFHRNFRFVQIGARRNASANKDRGETIETEMGASKETESERHSLTLSKETSMKNSKIIRGNEFIKCSVRRSSNRNVNSAEKMIKRVKVNFFGKLLFCRILVWKWKYKNKSWIVS